MNRCRIAVVLALGLLAAIPTQAGLGRDRADKQVGFFRVVQSYNLRAGETNTGDLYLIVPQTLNLYGHQQGDLIGYAGMARIRGTVDGDIFMAGSTLDIDGEVLDSVRYVGSTFNINGIVDGSVIFIGAYLTIAPGAVITGDVHAIAGGIEILGTVEGNLTFTGGKVDMGGTIVGDTELEADQIRFDDTASLLGDLTYHARNELEDAIVESAVAGEIVFEEKREDDEEPEPMFTFGSVMFHLWSTLAAFLVGVVLIALFRPSIPRLTARVGTESMMAALIGLGVFFVVPTAAALAIALVLSLPLGVITLLLFVVAAYVAKVPVAIWVGNRGLALVGMNAPSPFLALLVGLVPLYLLFAIPFTIGPLIEVGTLFWLIATWLGLGAAILAIRDRYQADAA